jgi:hypothetical protein
MVTEPAQIRESLRQLFEAAAAKSLAVINQDDAESEMVRFLHEVKEHPDQRPFVVQLFVESFGDSFYMWRQPWEFLAFCMHDLRWPELRDFITAKWHEDADKRGARSSTIWKDILAAFEDDWSGAQIFQEFKHR